MKSNLKLLLIFGSDTSKAQEDFKKLQSCAEELSKWLRLLLASLKVTLQGDRLVPNLGQHEAFEEP